MRRLLLKAENVPQMKLFVKICDLLLIAAGFVGCEESTLSVLGLRADAKGRLLPEDGSHHLGGKLFSAGDMRNGQSLVVRALADGRAAAEETNRFLRQYP